MTAPSSSIHPLLFSSVSPSLFPFLNLPYHQPRRFLSSPVVEIKRSYQPGGLAFVERQQYSTYVCVKIRSKRSLDKS